jgi:ATP-dependent RNA helicase RhlE
MDLMQQGHVDLRGIEVLVLDEADRMLDMGFINDIRKIVAKLPKTKQTLLFSATMPNEIRRLADSLMTNPVTVQIAPAATTVDLIEQSVYFVDKKNKPQLLAHLVESLPMSRAIVFTRTKHGADRVVRHLHKSGIKAEAIHGNKSQNARQRALDGFKVGRTPVLVATDIASRGIDVDDVSHVVNYDLTHEPETYVHRIGRTGRAGATGKAVSFCDSEERSNLRAIERLIRKPIAVKNDHPVYSAVAAGSHDRDDRDERPERSERSFGGRQGGHQGGRSSGLPRSQSGGRPHHAGGRGPAQQNEHPAARSSQGHPAARSGQGHPARRPVGKGPSRPAGSSPAGAPKRFPGPIAKGRGVVSKGRGR